MKQCHLAFGSEVGTNSLRKTPIPVRGALQNAVSIFFKTRKVLFGELDSVCPIISRSLPFVLSRTFARPVRPGTPPSNVRGNSPMPERILPNLPHCRLSPPFCPPGSVGRWLLALAFVLLAAQAQAQGDDIDEAEAQYRTGHYAEARKVASEQVAKGTWVDRWHLLKIRTEMAAGLYTEARKSLEDALRRLPESLALYLLGREVYLQNGDQADADAMLEAIEKRIQFSPSRYNNPEGRVLVGRFYLLKKLDAKKVLDLCYDRALKQKPDLVEALHATAELALVKEDGALAATTLAKIPRDAPDEPWTHYLLARAFDESDRTRSESELDRALKINPNHVDSLLLRTSHRIDEEKYDDASKTLDQINEVNPREPRAWAYRAVIAHLKNDAASEKTARETALARWKTNPEVDHLIGKELSGKYRFLEGSTYQRQALTLDPAYLPAQVQLCQDLLRLGQEDEGWKLADSIFKEDGYNVLAFNLTNLRDRIKTFRTLEAPGLLIRMDPREADLYGARVVALLERARKTLAEKYGATLPERVTVEIFPSKKEFAVRTFGLPGAEGFLGVCFGNVITANSPASQGETPSNWEAVLWHEFCHVVTLSKTRNKMPRWLSEGISVYEEERENPAWKTALSLRYREMLLADDLTPLSRLSSAFLTAKSALHIQFAYYESALAVAFLVEKSSPDAVRGILEDLGEGISINDALTKRTGKSLDALDSEFKAYARARAESLAPGMTWEDPKLPETAELKAIEDWLKDHPKNIPGLKRLALKLVTTGDLSRARDVVAQLKKAYPDDASGDSADALLALICRKANDVPGERQALEALASKDGNAGPVLLRLLSLEEKASDWKTLETDAQRLLAINPLIAAPHRALATASEALGHDAQALDAYRGLAILDDIDAAETHYRLARLLAKLGKDTEARREVLKSLDVAPRFLDAHKLLLELAEPSGKPSNETSTRPQP